MTEVTFMTASPVHVQQNPRNAYRLVIEFSHGDGDGESQNGFSCAEEDTEKLKAVCQFLHAYDQSSTNDQHDYREMWAWEELAEKLKLSNYLDYMTDLLDGDHTCDYQYRAYIDSWAVTYFDSEGVEHDVFVKVV